MDLDIKCRFSHILYFSFKIAAPLQAAAETGLLGFSLLHSNLTIFASLEKKTWWTKSGLLYSRSICSLFIFLEKEKSDKGMNFSL